MKILCMLLLTIIPSQVIAQIAQLRMPSEVAVGDKVVAVCEAQVPENGKLMILWDYSERLDIEQAESGDKLFIWGKPGLYSVEAIIIPLKTITLQDQTFDVVAGNISRVKGKLKIIGKVDPGPEPDPEVPFAAPGYAVMVLKEAKDTLPASQQAIFSSPKILNWLKNNCIAVDSVPMFRFWDDDYTTEYLQNVDPLLKNAYTKVRQQSNGQVPWIAISNQNVGFSGPLPMTVDQTIKLLETYK